MWKVKFSKVYLWKINENDCFLILSIQERPSMIVSWKVFLSIKVVSFEKIELITYGLHFFVRLQNVRISNSPDEKKAVYLSGRRNRYDKCIF